MKTIVFLCAILGSSLSAPSESYVQYAGVSSGPAYYTQHAGANFEKISKPTITGTLHLSQDTYGQYKYGYSSSDGQDKEESRNTDGGVDGKFRYTSPEGQQIALTYEAGKDGFQAIGDHLPEAPEVPQMPEELAAAYKLSNDRLTQAYEEAKLRGDTENSDDGSYKPEKYEGGENAAVASSYAQTNQAPTYLVPTGPAYQTTYVRKDIVNPSYPTNTYSVSKEPKKSKAPVPYVASSYSTEIGGVPVAKTVKATIQSEEIPKTNYAYRTGHY